MDEAEGRVLQVVVAHGGWDPAFEFRCVFASAEVGRLLIVAPIHMSRCPLVSGHAAGSTCCCTGSSETLQMLLCTQTVS
jgi:hypothetical protein